jgi:signal transduction histidine kinase
LGLSVGLAGWTGLVADIVWPVVPLGGVAILSHVLAHARRAAVSQRANVAQLAAISPTQVAREAVAEERARLLGDVHDVLRTAIESMQAHARDAQNSPSATAAGHVRAVQRDGRQAIGELRRLLGLLRETALEPPTGPAEAPPAGPQLRPGDVAVAVAVGMFAGLEFWLWPDDWGPPLMPPPTPLSMSLSIVGAAAIVTRRVNPGAGAVAVGVLLAIGAASDRLVGFGLGMMIAVVALTWSAMGRARMWPAVAVGVLIAGATLHVLKNAATNVQLDLSIFAGTAVVSLAAARHRSAARSSAMEAERLAAVRRTASDRAVWAERVTVARELHDVVSHAVVVMTVQAGAAETLLPDDRAAARRALDLVVSVGASTLNELDRLFAAAGDGPARLADGNVSRDIPALVRRMRAGGLSLHLSIQPPADPSVGPVAYRVVQETLTNTLRHAPTATVQVTVRSSATETTVEVIDDGPGPARAGPARGYGLIGMSERVAHCGGTIETGQGPGGRGFRVFARIPVPSAEVQS